MPSAPQAVTHHPLYKSAPAFFRGQAADSLLGVVSPEIRVRGLNLPRSVRYNEGVLWKIPMKGGFHQTNISNFLGCLYEWVSTYSTQSPLSR